MNFKNDWMIAAPLCVSLVSMGPPRAVPIPAKNRAEVQVQKAPVQPQKIKADYTDGSAGKAGTNRGRGQLVGTGVTSRAAASMMIVGDPVSSDAGADQSVAEVPAKDGASGSQVSRHQ
jgi:hypothetical protein